MRSLLNFLERYRHVIVFLILEIFAVSMVVMENEYHNSKIFNGIRSISGSIQDKVTVIDSYFKLKRTNDQLAQEVEKLKNQLAVENMTRDSLFRESVDTLLQQRYEYMSAKVIGNSVARQKNYITLNRGSGHGVETGMGVIGHQGVIGIVVGTSNNYSVVMSFLHPDMRLSVRIKKNNYFGSLKWTGKSYREAILNEIPHHVEIALGDTIETTGFSQIFPQGLFVGTIIGYSEITGDFYTIETELAADFKKLEFVYLIRNLSKGEREELENGIIE